MCPADCYPIPGSIAGRAPMSAVTCGFTSSRAFQWRPDVVHSFGRLAYLIPLLPWRVPKVMSYQRPVTERSVRWAEKLARGTLYFTGCSAHLIRNFAHKNNWRVIYNAAPAGAYNMNPSVSADAPLVFLGHLGEVKGPRLIEVARRRQLANQQPSGNVAKGDETFFERQVKPQHR